MKHVVLGLIAFVLTAPALDRAPAHEVPVPALGEGAAIAADGEFTFVRIIYNSPFRRGRRGSWSTDFPEADYHFIAGVRYWSGANLGISPTPVQLEILNERLFDFPLVYFVEPGYMELSYAEAERLREYVSRGGFLFLDDFWGEYEWQNVREQMRRIFPDLTIKDLPLSHPVFHSYFDIEEVVQVPGIGTWLGQGVTYERDGIIPHYMGIEDEAGRLVAFISRNCDLGDAWEWIDDRRYPMKYGLAAYQVGLNVIMYAMTH